jgi:regulator of sigma E protease
MLTTIAVLFVFTLVVVVHELGHLLVCRWLGVRVEKFAVGFGKEIFGVEWKGIRWSFCLLPLGGYVKPAGEDMEERTGSSDEFFSQSWYGRIAIALAGPTMNYLLAFVCFFWLMFFWGQPQPSSDPVIGDVASGYPAQAAGFQKGDRILAINGRPISNWEEAAGEIHKNPEKTIDIRYRRAAGAGQEERIIALVPKKDPRREVGLIGISPTIAMVPQGFRKSLHSAYDQCVFLSVLTVRYIGQGLQKAILHGQKPELELAGPIGIVSIIANVVKEGFHAMVSLLAIISLNLGLFNLFPIPLLDGGHVFLYLLEGLFGKPLNKSAVRAANFIGATFLILIFLFATTQDITRLKSDLFK